MKLVILDAHNLCLVMRKGDEADCMYIIYHGEVGIFADYDCTIQFATVKPNQVFGEKALENNNNRGASVKALRDSKMLRLKKLFFKSIVLVSQWSIRNLGCNFDAKVSSVRFP